MDKTLVIMAAGLSSRYSGVKQIERVGPGGEMLMDYAVYDAVRAGFNKIVFVLKQDIADDIKALFDRRIGQIEGVSVSYSIQSNDRFTDARPSAALRTKPLGTVHAVLCAKEYIHSPFAVINADDYYGVEAFRLISRRLDELKGAQDAAMAAYRLCNTVSRYGAVTRGICVLSDGYLDSVTETYNIRLMPDGSILCKAPDGDDLELDPDSFVSMNMWGLHHDILPIMEGYFNNFIMSVDDNDLRSECLLPVMMDSLTSTGNVRVSAADITDRWFGLTYKDDKYSVSEYLKKLHVDGVYPPVLWNE